MKFCRFFCSVKFVVRSLGQFLGAVSFCGYPDYAVTPTRRRRKQHGWVQTSLAPF